MPRRYEPDTFWDEPPAFMEEVAGDMEQLFPRASSTNDVLRRVAEGKLSHCSYPLDDSSLTRECFRVALEKIVREEGDAPVHAKKHSTFPLAAQILREMIDSSSERVTWRVKTREVRGGDAGKPILQSNVVFETPPLTREVERPTPYLWAVEVSRRLQGNDPQDRRAALQRELKKACREREVGFGLIAACYFNLQERDMLALFENEEMKKELKEKQWTHPSEKRPGDYETIQELRTTLMGEDEHGFHPHYRPEVYQRALGLLVRAKLIPDEEQCDAFYDWRDETDTVQAVGVMLGASQPASEIVARKEDFPKEKLLSHIRKIYERIGTTVTKTVYLPSVHQIRRWPEMK